jgi:hypothetical protein
MIADPSAAETELSERRNMHSDTEIFLFGMLTGGIIAIGVMTFLSGGDEEKLRHYRSVLIKHGVAEYRADENGEPMFVIKAEPIKP